MNKVSIIALLCIASTTAQADTITVYGEKVQENTNTISSGGTTIRQSNITCSGGKDKVCYTRTTGSSTPQAGTQIVISTYKNGYIDNTYSGILRYYNEDLKARTSNYTIELQNQN